MNIAHDYSCYDELIHSLHQTVRSDYATFSCNDNPATVFMAPGKEHQLAYVLGQYCFLPKNIVDFLLKGQRILKTVNWKSVVADLDENIKDEQGKRTDGIPHYELLASGIQSDIGLDIKSVQKGTAVKSFLDNMTDALVADNPANVGGCLYALEHTAAPEITVIKHFANFLHTQLKGKPLQSGNLRNFLDDHIETFEPDHEINLQRAFWPHIRDVKSRQEFRLGFLKVLNLMENWWEEMVQEAKEIKPKGV